MRISTFLPDAIAQALKSYHRFAKQDAPPDAREFSAHHSACKVAIAHIELLIKLARWADLPDEKAGDANQQVMLAAMMQQAESEVQAYRRRENKSASTDTDKMDGDDE